MSKPKEGESNFYTFDPNLDVDIQLNTAEFASMGLKEKKEAAAADSAATESKKDDVMNPMKEKVHMLPYKGEMYLMRPKPDTGDMVCHIYDSSDHQYTRILGEATQDPLAKGFKVRVRFY